MKHNFIDDLRWQPHPSPQLVDELVDTITGMSPMPEAHARINAVMREPQHWNGQHWNLSLTSIRRLKVLGDASWAFFTKAVSVVW